jgi:hypothetical protein
MMSSDNNVAEAVTVQVTSLADRPAEVVELSAAQDAEPQDSTG